MYIVKTINNETGRVTVRMDDGTEHSMIVPSKHRGDARTAFIDGHVDGKLGRQAEIAVAKPKKLNLLAMSLCIQALTIAYLIVMAIK
jgi:hypothetical protein